MKMASNFFPLRNKTSDTTIMDRTTKSNTQFIAPILSIKFLIITVIQILLKGINNNFKNLTNH